MRIICFLTLVAVLAPMSPAQETDSSFSLASTDVWCPHVTAAAGWKTEIDLYASGSSVAQFQVERFDTSGNTVGSPINGTAAAKGWTTIPPTTLNYEGTARVTSSRELLVKAVYQLGSSPAVCEFYLTGAAGTTWVLPNVVRPWMGWTGLALVNPGGAPVTVTLEAWKGGVKAASDATVVVSAKNKYVRLSDGVWPGLGYAGLDTVVVRSTAAIPAPIDITGNTAGDRYLFFAAQAESIAGGYQAGDLVAADPIVGNLRFVPRGVFIQGSPANEPCCLSYQEGPQFQHTLTRELAVMELEVTQRMWADLKAAQPSLPVDPSYFTATAFPVQRPTWPAAVLFANLFSLQRGLTRCYYTDGARSTPIDAANYMSGHYYCCDFSAAGFRLVRGQ